jgi:hypothetical protein
MSRNVPSPPHPAAALAEPVHGALRPTREWYDWLIAFARAVQFNTPTTGTATFAGAATAAVTFATPEPDTSYNVHVEPPENRGWWITGKSTSGFTINLSAASSTTYAWTVVRR